jgi:phospho-N-acetylmuramoyl-pentapeptide-transferase
MDIVNVIKVFTPATMAFFVGLALTPIVAHYLYKCKAWKKQSVQIALDGKDAPISRRLHKDEEKKVPRMGGIIIWLSAVITILFFWFLAEFFTSTATEKLNFLSRNQTWLPLFTLIAASIVGLVDDILVVQNKGGHIAGGLSLRTRIFIVLTIGAIGGWWFFVKLGISSVLVPFVGEFSLGLLFIPFFMLVMLALFSGSVLDGIDGLSGGILASIFVAYAGIAFFQNQIDIAAFCAVLVGGLLAFLWFNIPPARFYMSETGILGLTTTLTVIAFLTNAVLVLPLIAFPLLAAPTSSILQILSKKYFGKKLFLVAPIHHHFEALGWPPQKVVMRFWVLGAVCALLGMIIALVA